MKNLAIYRRFYGNHDPDQLFERFFNSLSPQIFFWDYFVDWSRVLGCLETIEIELQTLNFLIGKPDFKASLGQLLKTNPSIVKAFPYLAVRTSTVDTIKIIDKNNDFNVYQYDFGPNSPNNLDDWFDFFQKTGLLALIKNRRITNLVDYVLGVEAGLNSHARKNRTGKLMEEISHKYIEDFSNKHGWSLTTQASGQIIKDLYLAAPETLVSRRYDFVVKAPSRLLLFETNLYNTSGTKLKATAGEYRAIQKEIQANPDLADRLVFIWLTDGPGWRGAKQPLKEAWFNIDYIFNLTLLEGKVLEHQFGQSSPSLTPANQREFFG